MHVKKSSLIAALPAELGAVEKQHELTRIRVRSFIENLKLQSLKKRIAKPKEELAKVQNREGDNNDV